MFVTARLLPLFLISENKLIWVNALFYSTPICSVFLSSINSISVTSRIKIDRDQDLYIFQVRLIPAWHSDQTGKGFP